MKGIVQSQIYQIKKDSVLWGAFLGMMLLTLLPIPVYVLFKEVEISGGYFAVSMGSMNIYSVIFLIVISAYIVGQDFLDKTAYYDILYGYKRSAVFWGRVIPMLIVTVVMSMVLLLLMPFVATILYGWGMQVAVSEFLFRCVLYILIVVRMCCEVTFLTVVCHELYQVYAIEFVLYLLVEWFLNVKNPYVFVSSATREVFAFSSWTIFHIDGTAEVLYENTLQGSTIVVLVLSSIGVSVLYLFLARHYFEVKDMN